MKMTATFYCWVIIYTPLNGTTQTYYYLLNIQGDVVGLIDESLSIVVRYSYDPWGRLLSVTDSSGSISTAADFVGNVNPLRYRSYYYDSETGFYYLQSRYYDPNICRFLNADGYVTTDITGLLSGNMYAYCENNPVNASDPTGEFGLFAIVSGVVGAATSAAAKIVSNIATGKEWSDGVAAAAIGGAVYNVVTLVSGGNMALASVASAAAEATANEIATYWSGEKELTLSNLAGSAANIATETAVGSITTIATGQLANKAIPINNGWFKPKKIRSCICGKYAKKMEAQSSVQALLTSAYNIALEYAV